jgi:hypothetical protein
MHSLAAHKSAGPVTSRDGGHYAQPPFATVEEGLAAIHDLGANHLTTDALRDDLRWIATQQRALEAMNARWLAGAEPPSFIWPLHRVDE